MPRSEHPTRRRTLRLCQLAALTLLAGASLARATPTVTVYAAASLTDALNAVIADYEADHDADIVAVYAASSTAARQIANGAPADLYVSANERWMDWLAEQDVTLTQRADLLSNRLVLIGAPQEDAEPFTPGAGQPVASRLDDGRRLAVGDPDHVPAGIYARQALESLGEWRTLEPRLARGDNVRAALALVERGEAPLGIVYRSDAQASDKVHQLGVFPADSHQPITYPLALIDPPASDAARAFRDWLTGDEAMTLFTKFGFSPAPTTRP
ncbi:MULTISPECIES: molybdate ABC transporter substrate-binding protein [Modicisalibacter]|uniref:molybdate ABC transporter substrate-binding protein n=1 Tax=Modicisalibacter TaxID=574347 RepID=UPI00100C0DD3|nr:MULTISPECIES: molybdate ABC transporter substrate-binding protein [Halomonadaceae]MBZ9560152.1 molybdate ABC transporter substrate-binding protein [Modicisalibacter sp. R2A 31.J]MBZ9576060.1 molybdate ABC transporter substrate-binding protein [Modicisalibacter sp. MOD 31.J]